MGNTNLPNLQERLSTTWKLYLASKRLISLWGDHSTFGLDILNKIRVRSMVLLGEAWNISQQIHHVQSTINEVL